MLALRGAATLKARALKEVWNIAAVIPVERGGGGGVGVNGAYVEEKKKKKKNSSDAGVDEDDESLSGEVFADENFLGLCSQELLARGTELLKRTRKGLIFFLICFFFFNYLI